MNVDMVMVTEITQPMLLKRRFFFVLELYQIMLLNVRQQNVA